MGAYLIIFGVIVLDILAIVDVKKSGVENAWAYIVLIVAIPLLGFSIWYLTKTFLGVKKKSPSGSSIESKKRSIKDYDLMRLNESLIYCNRIFRESDDYNKLRNKLYIYTPSESNSIIDNLASQYDVIINALASFLSNRECLVCILSSLEISEDSIASLLFVTNTTVRAYKSKIKSKLPASYYEMFILNKVSALKRNTYSKRRQPIIQELIFLFIITTVY